MNLLCTGNYVYGLTANCRTFHVKYILHTITCRLLTFISTDVKWSPYLVSVTCLNHHTSPELYLQITSKKVYISSVFTANEKTTELLIINGNWTILYHWIQQDCYTTWAPVELHLLTAWLNHQLQINSILPSYSSIPSTYRPSHHHLYS